MKKLILFIFVLNSFSVFCQQNLVLYNMPSVHQSMYVNPGQMPQCRVNVGLPFLSSIYFNLGNNGFKFTDLVKKRADDSLMLDIDNVLSKLRKRNRLVQSFQLDLISFGFRVKQNYFSFSAIEKETFGFSYPKDFFNWVWKGNGEFLGEEMNFNFGINAMHYREYGLGYTRILTEQLSAGIKAKYLYGMENFFTEKSDITFLTGDPYFDYTARANIKIHTSGIDTNSFDNFDMTDYLFRKKNSGVAVDLGAVFRLNDRFSFSASLIDFGYIKWKSDVTNYVSAHPDAEFKFDGIDISQYITSSGTFDNDSALNHLSDSVQEIFKIDTTHNAYKTSLPTQLYAGVNFKLSEKQNAGLVLQGQFLNKEFHAGMALSYNVKLKSWFSASASYAILNRSYNNIGLGFSITGPVQWYVITDNVIGFFLPHSSKTINFRTGINLCFGRRPKEDKINPAVSKTSGGLFRKKDTDKDGIPDKADTCVYEKGLKEFNGCPDKDGDKIIDKKDSCPDIAGIAALNGCPDKDGDSIIDKKDSCPDIAGIAELNGCPDKDGDKIIDKLDSCPDHAGLAEYFGCPDLDGDRIIDKDDICPDEAGNISAKGCPDKDEDGINDKEDRCPDKPGIKENDGCPLAKLHLLDKQGNITETSTIDKDGKFHFTHLPSDENILFKLESFDVLIANEVTLSSGTLVRVARRGADGYFHYETLATDKNKLGTLDVPDTQIKLTKEEAQTIKHAMETLEFDSGKDVIRSSSAEGLDLVSELLSKNKTWRLKLSGHTDNTSSAKFNMNLSKKRVESVRNYLVKKGVETNRIVLKWFGPAKPIAPNNTEEGRQKNRRVEFLIIK